MKCVIASLCFVLLSHQVHAEEVPTGNSLVRLVCQSYAPEFEHDRTVIDSFHGFVLILEQTSSRPLNTETALSDTIDGSLLIDPDNEIPTDRAAFRLRVYRANLVSESFSAGYRGGWPITSAQAQIIENLLSGDAGLDFYGRAMDYRGKGFQLSSHLMFDSESAGFLKSVQISMEDFTGFMDTNLGASNPIEDGLYACWEPILVPETTQQANG